MCPTLLTPRYSTVCPHPPQEQEQCPRLPSVSAKAEHTPICSETTHFDSHFFLIFHSYFSSMILNILCQNTSKQHLFFSHSPTRFFPRARGPVQPGPPARARELSICTTHGDCSPTPTPTPTPGSHRGSCCFWLGPQGKVWESGRTCKPQKVLNSK
uniref:Uncharacterized protein n=1 Tax=Molossus molossus TaxID=27622 RepID=A0A7J8BKL6_MOLMO|nr:hypothetical protein HJG59_010149 [Molossus molossus]